MKFIAISILCLLFLAACAKDELPPVPPPPGAQTIAGKAAAGIVQLAPGAIPGWALPLDNTEVTFTDKEITVKVKKPSSAKGKFYAYTRSYFYDKPHRSWVENRAVLKESGKLSDVWNEEYAVFRALLDSPLFTSGQNFFVVFYCYEIIEDGEPKRDSKGYKVWGDCKKYHLGAFEASGSYPNVLIEKQIENEFYKGSSKVDTPLGPAYTATYEDRYNKVKTTVTITNLKGVDDFKKSKALEVAALDPLWTKNGNVCGFQKSDSGQTSYWWLSGSYLVTVVTFANTIASDKIGNYGTKYQSDCQLLEKLKTIAKGGANVCGNGKAEPGEQCDNADDSVCPGVCKPDCTCGWIGSTNTGVCGDYIIQKPNSVNIIEQCELPGKRDSITGQLLASACFVRDSAGKISGVGACDELCRCNPDVKVSVPDCYNGKPDAGEYCGDPGTGLCKSGEVCKDCGCIPIPQSCVYNGKVDSAEKCDPTANPSGCSISQVCSPTCVCANAMASCGNSKIDPGEQCEANADCKIAGLFGKCSGCNCWYFLPPGPGPDPCGNGNVDAGEQCDGAPCANGAACQANCQCGNPPQQTCAQKGFCEVVNNQGCQAGEACEANGQFGAGGITCGVCKPKPPVGGATPSPSPGSSPSPSPPPSSSPGQQTCEQKGFCSTTAATPCQGGQTCVPNGVIGAGGINCGTCQGSSPPPSPGSSPSPTPTSLGDCVGRTAACPGPARQQCCPGLTCFAGQCGIP